MKTLLFWILITQIYFAQNYRVETVIVKGARDKNEAAKVNYIVYNGKDELYSVTKEFPYDMPYSSGVADANGNLYLCTAFDTGVEIYNKDAVNIASVKLFPEDKEYERTMHIAGLDNSVIIGVSEPKQMQAKVFQLDSRGTINNRLSLNRKYVTLIAGDAKMGIFAVSAYGFDEKRVDGKTYFYNDKFMPLSELNTYFTRGEFFENGRYFAANNNKIYTLYNLTANKTIESGEINNGTVYKTFFLNGDLFYIKYLNSQLKNGNWELVNPQLFKVKNGITELLQIKLPSEVKEINFDVSNNNLGLLVDGKRIFIVQ